MGKPGTGRDGRRGGRKGGGRAAKRDAPAGAPPAQQEAQQGGPPPTGAPPTGAVRFPVVGLGASAGGLEALEAFLKNVPAASGMAYVVVQHLDPNRPAALAELLGRSTPMPVEEAREGVRVLPDRVYVGPPNHELTIRDGVLRLAAPPSGRTLPIDRFLGSLAGDRAEDAIGVVLSGMGTDGTLGLRAIKEHAGAAFVQSIGSAKFDGMPRSAIDSGVADVVAPVEALPGRIVAFHRHASAVRQAESSLDERQHSGLEKIFALLRSHTGNDFTLYKRSTLFRRIERRMGLHQLADVGLYVRYLRENPAEIDLLHKELLIGVTGFFRDPAAWELLRKEVLPAVVAARAPSRVLRAWVPGCSTGEEAYSLAIVLKEVLDAREAGPPVQLQVFATDLDRDAVERGRTGVFPASVAQEISPERLRRFFLQDERGYRISKEIREAVVFAPQNLVMDPPFTKMDVVSCRNVLIYLAPELQKKLIPLFHYALNPGGILLLGSAETTGSFASLFTPLDAKARIYRRVDAAAAAATVDFPASFVPPAPAGSAGGADPARERRGPYVAPQNLQTLADQVIVQRYAPAAVLTTERGDVLYISGRTGKFLEPAVGRANLNLFAMAREGLRRELAAAFARALRQARPVVVKGLQVGTNGGTQAFDLTVQRLPDPGELHGTVMVVMTEAAPPAHGRPAGIAKARAARGRIEELEAELQRAREDLQTTREEMQTSQEELTSTNEELQSTNEELTTSKEEMQSMNEELQTVNQELQAKVDELSRSNNDMKNLLNSTEVATLFLDGELKVRRFTTQTARLFKLIPGDAGRPITDMAMDLDYAELVEDAREVLRTLVFKEHQAPTLDRARWFSVRILPYRTLENVIDGVVITFADVTAAKLLEVALREQATQLRQMLDALPTPALGCRADGSCDWVGARWVEYTGVPEGEQLGYGWLERVEPGDRERVREEWRGAVRGGAALTTELRLRRHDGQLRRFVTHAVPIHDAQGQIVRWVATSTEVEGREPEAGGGASPARG